MKWIYSPEQLPDPGRAVLGGKGYSLFQLLRQGHAVPKPLCISAQAYDHFVDSNHIREKIDMELHRKEMREMRWEELWDNSLRIKNLFLRNDIPRALKDEITKAIQDHFGTQPLVIRSSSLQEDDRSHSFAGLHDSFLDVRVREQVFQKIKLVWASLWTDRALLYRQELGLQVAKSSMAVVIQPFIIGETSGVMFTKNPLEPSSMLIEAVLGLNQGLVDGKKEPDRWRIDRKTGELIDHRSSVQARPYEGNESESKQDVSYDRLKKQISPLNDDKLMEVAQLGRIIEDSMGEPQDIEWTISDERLYLLQSRPITSASQSNGEDKRSWYLSLTRSYDNLIQLRDMVEHTLLPEMNRDYETLAAVDLSELDDEALVDEIRKRSALADKWTKTYWSDFIPLAHGARLFGQIYNDVIEPDDPFEFVLLLTGQDMISTNRNNLFFECASIVKNDAEALNNLRTGALDKIESPQFRQKVDAIRSTFALDSLNTSGNNNADTLLASVILEYCELEGATPKNHSKLRDDLEQQFIARGSEILPFDPQSLLELGQASYRLRDDDNIYLDRINQERQRAIDLAIARLVNRTEIPLESAGEEDICALLLGKRVTGLASLAATQKQKNSSKSQRRRTQVRQLLGQPASYGIARGKARVIREHGDLAAFKKGEVLVIDSIDPTMTFFAPLAAGIVERRGGMLIHGAIIAREYGVPCITGVTEATSMINTGELITVDGYLGICTVQRV